MQYQFPHKIVWNQDAFTLSLAVVSAEHFFTALGERCCINKPYFVACFFCAEFHLLPSYGKECTSLCRRKASGVQVAAAICERPSFFCPVLAAVPATPAAAAATAAPVSTPTAAAAARPAAQPARGARDASARHPVLPGPGAAAGGHAGRTSPRGTHPLALCTPVHPVPAQPGPLRTPSPSTGHRHRWVVGVHEGERALTLWS